MPVRTGFHSTVLATLLLLVVATSVRAQVLWRASRDTQGGDPNSVTLGPPASSADGRFVAFVSLASDLVSNDTNSSYDVFVYDRLMGTVSLVSLANDGSQGDNHSGFHNFGVPVQADIAISADGRYVAFQSFATNLTADANPPARGVYVRDTQNNTTVMASKNFQGNAAGGFSTDVSISSDGSLVGFFTASPLVISDLNGSEDAYVRDISGGTTLLISATLSGRGAGSSRRPSIGGTGRYVAFSSQSDSLVAPGIKTDNLSDVFVRDTNTGTNFLVSKHSDGTKGNQNSDYPSISDDGRYIAFVSSADNLVDDDTNGRVDVFVHDFILGETWRVSVASDSVS